MSGPESVSSLAPSFSRRQALRSLAFGGLSLTALSRLSLNAQSAPGAQTRALELPPLPYAFDALEPAIDERTMEIHHGRHHAGYTRNFKAAVDELALDQSVETILASLPAMPANHRATLRNNGGGFWNHAHFWESMAPADKGGGGQPSGALGRQIERDFGSFAAFREAFSTAGMTRFGSGWAWLVQRPDGSLIVTSTPNQDNPLMGGIVPDSEVGTPLLGLDVWEHAYYLHYQNRRADYIAKWWNVVNWRAVQARFTVA